MVSIFKRLRCLTGQHSPSRRSVHYEGHLKIGPCRYCGIMLEKRADEKWVVRRGGQDRG